MTVVDQTVQSQGESIAFEFDLHHAPQKVWRALTNPELLTQWLLPVIDLELRPGAAFTFQAPPQPGWDGIVSCRFLEIEAGRKLSWTWVVGDIDTVVTFTLTLYADRHRQLRPMSQGEPPPWVTSSPLFPLALLLLSGLYLFVLPYIIRRRGKSPGGSA